MNKWSNINYVETQHSLTIYYLLFIIYYLLFIIYYLLFIIDYGLLIMDYWLFIYLKIFYNKNYFIINYLKTYLLNSKMIFIIYLIILCTDY